MAKGGFFVAIKEEIVGGECRKSLSRRTFKKRGEVVGWVGMWELC